MEVAEPTLLGFVDLPFVSVFGPKIAFSLLGFACACQSLRNSWDVLRYMDKKLSLIGKPIPGTAFRVGDPIGNKWLVLDLLGKGGMGMVYLALEKKSSDVVALKTLRDDIHVTQTIRDRFHKEAHIWCNIGIHPHILKDIFRSSL